MNPTEPKALWPAPTWTTHIPIAVMPVAWVLWVVGYTTSSPDLSAAPPSAEEIAEMDFFELLRQLETEDRRFGRSGDAGREPARLGQSARMSFATSDLAAFTPARGAHPAQVEEEAEAAIDDFDAVVAEEVEEEIVDFSEPEPAPVAVDDFDSLLGDAAEAAAFGAFSELAKKTAVENGGITIEEIVRTELRPLLKTWLDGHLPTIIERLVQEELERVAKRALEE